MCQSGNIALSPANPNPDYPRAEALLMESIALARGLESHRWIEAHALFALANMTYWKRDTSRSIALFEESLALARRLGDTRMIALSLNELGDAIALLPDFARAAALSQ